MMGEAIHVLDQPGGMQLFDRRHNASVKGPPSVLEEARIRDLVAQGVLECEFRSEEHTSELQSQSNLVCRLLLEKKKKIAHQFEQAPDASILLVVSKERRINECEDVIYGDIADTVVMNVFIP